MTQSVFFHSQCGSDELFGYGIRPVDCTRRHCLGTASISTFCFTIIRKDASLLGQVGYMLGFVTHL